MTLNGKLVEDGDFIGLLLAFGRPLLPVPPSFVLKIPVRNPNHPSLCATASSNGTIGIWNFSQSLEEPITGSDGIVVEPDGGSGRGLNKLKWSSDGRRLLVASADRVHVLSLSEDVIRQKGDEDARMMNHLISRGLLERE